MKGKSNAELLIPSNDLFHEVTAGDLKCTLMMSTTKISDKTHVLEAAEDTHTALSSLSHVCIQTNKFTNSVCAHSAVLS